MDHPNHMTALQGAIQHFGEHGHLGMIVQGQPNTTREFEYAELEPFCFVDYLSTDDCAVLHITLRHNGLLQREMFRLNAVHENLQFVDQV